MKVRKFQNPLTKLILLLLLLSGCETRDEVKVNLVVENNYFEQEVIKVRIYFNEVMLKEEVYPKAEYGGDYIRDFVHIRPGDGELKISLFEYGVETTLYTEISGNTCIYVSVFDEYDPSYNIDYGEGSVLPQPQMSLNVKECR